MDYYDGLEGEAALDIRRFNIRRSTMSVFCPDCGKTKLDDYHMCDPIPEVVAAKTKKKIYIPFYNADMNEGRGPMVPKDFCFENKHEAQRYIDQQPGVQNMKGPWTGAIGKSDWQVKELVVYDNAEQAIAVDNDEFRKRALNKLTLQERKALGLE